MDLDWQLKKWEEEAGLTPETPSEFIVNTDDTNATFASSTSYLEQLPKSAFPSKHHMHEKDDELSVFPSETGQSDHCSALVKVAHGELFMGHATWTDYSEMLRVYKTLDYTHISHPSVASTSMSYSSYPGYLSSTDDWFLMQPTKLVVTETTLDVESDEILAQYVTVRSVLTPIRALVASTMAESGRQWYDIFSMHNSGTQNDQWHVVDFKKFTRGHPTLNIPAKLEPGTLYVFEQMPGSIAIRDKTQDLIDGSYWSSYNEPKFEQSLKVAAKSPTEDYFDFLKPLDSWRNFKSNLKLTTVCGQCKSNVNVINFHVRSYNIHFGSVLFLNSSQSQK